MPQNEDRLTDNPYESPPDHTPVEADVACPVCGTPCEQGVVQSLGNITWYPKMTSFKRCIPMRLSPKGLNLETKLVGLRCPECNTITIDSPSPQSPENGEYGNSTES